jgi:Astacin (Peptidase family M12A)
MPTATRICFDRLLPSEVMQPLLQARGPSRAAFFFRKLWPNGSVLRVRFLGGTAAQRADAMAQAGWWMPHVNLAFVESTDNDAEIRVSFDPSDGAWSYLGTDCRSIPADQPTMNLGFEDGGTAAHEFGHAIGLGHEHQNPQGGIEWNEPEVIRDLSRPPNSWTMAQIRHNVLDKYAQEQIRATAFDPKSIMLYFFPARWTMNGVGTSANEVLSEDDKSFAAQIYPRTALPAATRLTVGATPAGASIGAPGEEDQFAFTVTEAGTYVVETGGNTDVIMKLFGPDSPTALIAEDDDSGQGLNPRIVRALSLGEYLVQVRHYRSGSGTGAYTISVRR